MLCLHTNFNSLWPSYTIWRPRTGATLVQIMAPGHHLNQHWLIISKDQWKSPGCNFHKKYLNHQSLKMTLKITNPKFHSTLPGASESIINACTTFICLHLRWKKKSIVFSYDIISSLKLSYITSWSFQWWSNSFWKTQCFQHWQHGLADYSIFFSPLCWSYIFYIFVCSIDEKLLVIPPQASGWFFQQCGEILVICATSWFMNLHHVSSNPPIKSVWVYLP